MRIGRIKGKLLGKTEHEIAVERRTKEIQKRSKEGLKMAEYYSAIKSCKSTFLKVIKTERLNALGRRENHIGDSVQKARIHDAAVGLVAIEEIEYELNSAVQAGDFQNAQKKLGFVIKQVGRLDPNVMITKKDLKRQSGFIFDDTNETESFIERADLIDEEFVENLISGYTMKECMEKKTKLNDSSVDTDTIDFASGNQEADDALIKEALRKHADMR